MPPSGKIRWLPLLTRGKFIDFSCQMQVLIRTIKTNKIYALNIKILFNNEIKS